MAFHHSNYGKFSQPLKQYADLDGFVPEPGDDHEGMRWDAAVEWTAESWDEHVSEASEAKKEADDAMAEWRADNP